MGLDGALKVVSVVFSDLVGSTALQERLEPESARRVMARFYEAMRSVVELHGGAIQKFIGDAVVAVFGTPIVREDDALRAVRCAVAMTEQLTGLNDELERGWGVRLEMRTGVNTGELAVSDEGIFVGDTMNTAARLEQAAAAGQVLIGEATWRLVRREVELEEVDPFELRGKPAPVRVWKVISVHARSAAATEAPLVGRREELDRLRAGLDQAITARACRLVTVIGSPGLGKSRLAGELARSLDGQAMVLEGHCEASGEGITFLPVADVLRAAASIADDDSSEELVAKLRAVLPEAPDRERVVARVAGLLGAGAPAAPEETFWGVRSMLEALARERPLVVVLDDVHWGQPMFLDLIEHLVEWVRDAAILLVALARPELRELREALARAGRRAFDVIELEPLEPDQSRELVGGLLGEVELPDELLARILETTEGNPLFLGELLRMLVEEGSLERAGDVWVAAGGNEAVQVPPTIQALLTARIERLRAEERSVVERASVIGKQFYRGAVAELVAPPVRSGLDGHLETLRRKDLVEPEGTYWIDEPVYRFHHILIRDAAYHLLLKEARAELHEKFAAWLETKAGELVGEHEEVIAYHLEQAHEYRRQLGPLDERGKVLGARAAERLASAGRRALAREDLAAAANLLQRALDREAGGPEDEILWPLGEALLSAGDTANAAVVIDRLAGPRGDVLGAQLALLTGTGSLEQTLERVSAATAALAVAEEPAAEAKGHHVTAQVQAQLGRVADVESSLDHALLAARKADDRRRITAVLAAAPRAALWGPSPVVRASGRCLDVVRILRMTPGNRHVEAVALRCQAVLEAMRGRAHASREILAGGRATLEELGLTLELHELTMHAGIVELLAGAPDSAEAHLRSARDGFAALGVSVSAAQSAALLARALIEQQRDEDALAETEYAERGAGGDLKTTITWLGVRAEALARRGQVDEALDLARRAVDLADPTDALADKADTNMALARVLLSAGQVEEARGAAEAARALYLAKDHVVGVRRVSQLWSDAPPAVGPRAPVSPGLQTTLGGRPSEQALAKLRDAQNARDYGRLTELVAEDFQMADHRALGWPGAQGRERGIADIRSAFDASPDLRLDYEAVLACDDHVVVTLNAWRGRGLKAGRHEVLAGAVHLIRDGRWAGVDFYEPGDRQAMIARYAELGGGLSKVGNSPVERAFVEFSKRLAARDLESLLELPAEDFEWTDHRNLAWEPVRSREAMAALIRSGWEGNTDMRIEVDEVLACDGRVLAIRFRWVGHGSRAGAFELPAGQVVVNDGARNRSVDQYDGNDRQAMLARYAELGGTQTAPGRRPPERFLAEAQRLLDRREYGRLRRLLAEDWRSTDHRALGWEDLHGPEAWEASTRSFYEASPAARVEVLEVLACDDRVIAVRQAWRARGLKAGEMEVVAGAVYLVEEGRWISVDYYEPDDRRGMVARYAELGGGLAALGDSAAERVYGEFCRRYVRRDLAPVLELIAEDFVRTDHRPIGWEPARGRDADAALIVSAWEGTSDLRAEIDEVLAADDRALAVRSRWVGHDLRGGAFELPLGQVAVIEHGQLVSIDQYDSGERDAMLARWRALAAERSTEAPRRSAERLVAELHRLLNARDFDRFAEVVADDWYQVDHRALGWEEAHGRDACLSIMRSSFEASPWLRVEVDEVLACDDRVIAARGAWRGEGVKAGALEVSVGAVSAFSNGRWAGIDFYEPGDRTGMVARYAELGGGLGKLGDTTPERLARETAKAFAAQDLHRMVALYEEGIELVDHRALPWEPAPGGTWLERIGRFFASSWETTADIRMEVDEVLAANERALAHIVTWKGTAGWSYAGAFELSVGLVQSVRDGRFVTFDQYEPADREAMLARFEEVSREDQAVLGDRPPERFYAEYARRWVAGDPDGIIELAAEDWVQRDHRPVSLWGTVRRHELAEWLEAALRGVRDPRHTVLEVLACDDQVIACRACYSGTAPRGVEFEIEFGLVAVVRDGLAVSEDDYAPDDRQAMIARYVEAGGGLGKLGDTASERVFAEYARRYARRDYDAVLELMSEDYVQVDHRTLGWTEIGKEQNAAEIRSVWAGTTDIRAEVDEVLAADDRVLLCICTYRGSADATVGGGQFEYQVGFLLVANGRRSTRVEWFDPHDRDAMLARYRELSSDLPEAARLGNRIIGRWNSHDIDRAMELYAEDIEFLDHRSLGAEALHGQAAVRELHRAAFEVMPDNVQELDEILACDDRVIAFRIRLRGTSPDAAGGAFEVLFGGVDVFEGGKLVRVELFEPDDAAGMMQRYAELGGGL